MHTLPGVFYNTCGHSQPAVLNRWRNQGTHAPMKFLCAQCPHESSVLNTLTSLCFCWTTRAENMLETCTITSNVVSESVSGRLVSIFTYALDINTTLCADVDSGWSTPIIENRLHCLCLGFMCSRQYVSGLIHTITRTLDMLHEMWL